LKFVLWLILLCRFNVSTGVFAAAIDEQSVIGTRLPGQLRANVLLLDQDDIRSYAGTSAISVLQSNPLVFTQLGAGRGANNSLYLRGADPNFTLIQVDGLAVNDPTDSRGGAVDMGSFGLLGIESIDILAGASSSVYGSQALGGVINIKTRDVVGSELYGQLSPDGDGYSAGVVWGDEQWNLSTLYETGDNDVPGSRYTGRSIVARRSVELDAGRSFDVHVRYFDSDSIAYPDDSGGAIYAVSPELESRNSVHKQIGTAYRVENTGGSKFSLNASFSQIALKVDTPAVLPGLRDPFGLPAIQADSSYEESNISITWLSRQYSDVRVLGGLNYHRSSGKSDGVIDVGFDLPSSFALRRDQWSAFAEMVWRPLEQLSVSGGGRYEWFPNGEVFVPQLNVEYTSQNDRHTLMLNWGEGFKLPSFYALGNPLVGNPALENETSNSFEIKYSFESMNWALSVSVFRNQFRNLVDFEPGPPPSLVNRDKVKITGAELQTRRVLSNTLAIDAFVSVLDIEVVNQPTVKLRGRPESRIGLHMEWNPYSNLQLNFRARYSGSLPDSSIPTGNINIEPSSVLDINVIYTIKPNFTINGFIENALGENYQTSIGNMVSGPTFYLGFRYKLQD
jgi:vitamin B12 transporter